MWYRVRNRTSHVLPLYDAAGDCVHVNAHATALVDKKFIDFQYPPMDQFQVLGYVKSKLQLHNEARAKAAQAEEALEDSNSKAKDK